MLTKVNVQCKIYVNSDSSPNCFACNCNAFERWEVTVHTATKFEAFLRNFERKTACDDGNRRQRVLRLRLLQAGPVIGYNKCGFRPDRLA